MKNLTQLQPLTHVIEIGSYAAEILFAYESHSKNGTKFIEISYRLLEQPNKNFLISDKFYFTDESDYAERKILSLIHAIGVSSMESIKEIKTESDIVNFISNLTNEFEIKGALPQVSLCIDLIFIIKENDKYKEVDINTYEKSDANLKFKKNTIKNYLSV